RHTLQTRTAEAVEAAQRAAHEARAVARALPHAAHYQRALLEAELVRQLRSDDDGAEFDQALDRLLGDGPPAPWAQQDPADSLYRVAREQLNRGDYRAAARLFGRIRREDRFANSEYRAASHYWEAFALSRLGSADDLRAARSVLASMRTQHPGYDRIADADALAATINGRLARMGDARAARNLRSVARQQPQCGEDDDIRTAALNALFQMESANAIPILKEILARRDECSATLRVRAMMMLAQQNTAEAREILIDAALNDPDAEVREQATFWLSQVQDDAAVDALARILAGNASPSVQQKAVFALGQHRSERAAEILRQYAMRSDLSDELERHVVFSLAQSRDPENVAFLRELYQRADDRQVKQQIIVSLASTGIDNGVWLMSVALDENEDMEVRTQAL
ncbi:MAG: HEAT repeat domain-containing protein, partial [Longimicrobiales bacterium]